MNAIKIGTTVKLTDASKKMFADFDSNIFDVDFLAQTFVVKAFDSKTDEYNILPVNGNVKEFNYHNTPIFKLFKESNK